MSVTKELIQLQSPKEQAAFISFLAKRNKRHDTKNTQLYKDFLKGKEKQLLSELTPNAYNALKKRLTDLLIEFSAGQALSSELFSENKIIKYVVVSRKLINSGATSHGITLLLKAEKMAISLDHHSLLNEIYHTIIENAHMQSKIGLDILFQKLKQNNEQFLAQEKLGVLYAKMYSEFLGGKFYSLPSGLEQSLDKGLKEFDINTELILNFKSINQLCILSDLYGSQTKNYDGLDLFFEKHIATLQGTDRDTEKTLPYLIELMHGMANIYFRKKNLKRSMHYLNQMQAQLQRYAQKHLYQWQTRYTNLLALNLNFSGANEKGMKLISDQLRLDVLSLPEKTLLTLTLAMAHFQQGDISTVKKLLLTIDKTDKWYLKHMGNEWLFNFKAMEILMHFDLGNDLLTESRISSFIRTYGAQVKTKKDSPIWPFLKLIKSITFDHERINSVEFKEEVESSIPWKGKNEDIFNMCFYAWLKAKMTGRNVYDTTLDLFGTSL